MKETQSLKLEAALKYAELGLSIIPVSKDKIPLIDWKEFQSRKASEEEIVGWSKKFPNMNIGIVTGEISGIVAVDIEKGGDSSGYPPTVTAKTGGDGRHLIYKHPGHEMPNGTRVKELTDIRGDGGYIVAAPSISSKGAYEWLIPFESMNDLAEMPEIVKNMSAKTNGAKKWLASSEGAPEGERNSTAASVAGKILSTMNPDLWETLGWAELEKWNNKNDKPLPPNELRSVWESIKKYHSADPQRKTTIEQCDYLLEKIPKDTPAGSLISTITPILITLAAGTSLEEAELYICNNVKIALDIKTDNLRLIIKHFKKMKAYVQLKAEEAKKREEQIKKEPPMSEEEKKIAGNILTSPTLLYDILKMVKKLGVVGEERNVLLHYIIFTSRKLKHPLSATVKGDSSSGKSYTLLTTIKLLPKSAYIDLTDATPQSFFYCPEDHFKHKIIVIFEKHGGERADYAIRTLQSEGKLKIQVTVKNPETGQFEAQTIEKEGPTGFVTTTTASQIHAENDTRNISMFPDQSSAQTSRVYESVEAKYLGVQSVSEEEIKPWRNAQMELIEMPVLIPFAKSFKKYFPNHIVRTRRDYGHFLAVIEAVSFLHQKQREIIEQSGQKYIRATLADAYIAKVIVEDSLSRSIYELPEKTIEVIENARILVKKKDEEEEYDEIQIKDDKKTTFKITDLAKHLKWDRDTVAKWIKPAVSKGYLNIATESKGPKGAEYVVEEKDLPGDSFLPSVANLVADNPEEKIRNIYNPLTGEDITETIKQEILSTDAQTQTKASKNTEIEEGKVNPSVETVCASVEDPDVLEMAEIEALYDAECEKDKDGIAIPISTPKKSETKDTETPF